MSTIKLRPHKKIGFIGLGMMGSRMVHHIKDYGDLLVFDADEQKTKQIASNTNAVGARTLEDFSNVDVVITMLPNSSIIDEIINGSKEKKGLKDILPEGALILDMSSATPANSVLNAQACAENGVVFIDAPVSGGPVGAETAKLAIMVGCQEGHFDKITPLLDRMGTNVVRAGDVGAGHAVKALNNLLGATVLAATSEIFAAGEKFGLDPAMMQRVISASSGGSFMTSVAWPKAVLGKTWDFGFSLGLMTKDVGIGMSLIKDAGIEAPLCSTNAKIWNDANNSGHGSDDMTYIARQVREQAGLS